MKNLAFLMISIMSLNYVFAQKPNLTILSNEQVYLANFDVLGETKPISLEEDKSGNYKFATECLSPDLFYFSDKKSNSIKYFIVFPGDTVLIHFSPDTVTIRKSRQNEIYLLDSFNKKKANVLFNYEGGNVSVFDDFEKANQKSKELYSIRLSILNSYVDKLDKNFVDLIKSINMLKRLDFLLAPYNPCSPVSHFAPKTNSTTYFAEVDSLMSNVNFLKEKYIHINNSLLARIFLNYSYYISRDCMSTKFDCKFEASKSFDDFYKNIYLTIIMRDKVNNDYVNSKYLNRYLSICNNDSLKEKVMETNKNLQRLRSDLSLQMTPLREVDNKTFTWSELCRSSPKKITYVDFWASWCSGCRANLVKIKEMKKKFTNLEVVFVSRDASLEKWLKSIDAWGLKTLGRQFHIDPQSELAKILAQPSIPRGTLIDGDGNVVSIDTDAPNSQMLNDLLQNISKNR